MPAGWGRRRGSTLLLVLALLALLFLMATTLSYVSKLEVQATANAALRVQARMAAVTGIPVTATRLAVGLNSTGSARSAAASESVQTTAAPTPTETPDKTSADKTARKAAGQGQKGFVRNEQTGLANTQAEDQSALFNINALAIRATETLAENAASPASSNASAQTQSGDPYQSGPAGSRSLHDGAAQTRLAAGQAPKVSAGLPVEILERFLAERLSSAQLSANRASSLASAIHQYYAPREGEYEARDLQKKATRLRQQTSSRIARTALTDAAPGFRPTSNSNQTHESKEQTTPAAAETQPGSHQVFDRLSDLKRVANMSDAEFEAIAPYLTTFSSSLDVWWAKSGTAYFRVPINEATDEQIYRALRIAQPDTDENQLRQIAVNIVDRRDTDSVPTVSDDVKGSFPIIGYERTVRISEVCSEVMCVPEDGADGQYIELHNPTDKSINVAGWKLEWGTGAHTLTGTLPANGFLIVTNDLKNDQDSKPETNQTGMGSFYDVFHRLPNGTSEQVLEVPALDLQDNVGSIGRVNLRDQGGHLIDYLTFHSGAFTGQNRGYRKTTPFSHIGALGPATPFADDTRDPDDTYAAACWGILKARMDQPFQSVGELLALPVFFSEAGAQETQNQKMFPSLEGNNALGPNLLDCFRTTAEPDAFDDDGQLRAWQMSQAGTTSKSDTVSAASQTSEAEVKQAASHASQSQADTTAVPENQPGLNTEDLIGPQADTEIQPPVSYGKINLNTAPAVVLQALPGLDAELAARIVALQARARKNTTAGQGAGNEAFRSFAEFAGAADVWKGVEPVQRLEALLRLLPFISVNSTAFLVTSSNRDGALDETGRTSRDETNTRANNREETARTSRQACRALIHQVPGLGAVVLKWQFQHAWN
jgi:type II secretory pathway component PulK